MSTINVHACMITCFAMCLQDFELFRVFDALEFEDAGFDKQSFRTEHVAELDGQQTRVMMQLVLILKTRTN